jgi:hypothetical protein
MGLLNEIGCVDGGPDSVSETEIALATFVALCLSLGFFILTKALTTKDGAIRLPQLQPARQRHSINVTVKSVQPKAMQRNEIPTNTKKTMDLYGEHHRVIMQANVLLFSSDCPHVVVSL